MRYKIQDTRYKIQDIPNLIARQIAIYRKFKPVVGDDAHIVPKPSRSIVGGGAYGVIGRFWK